MNNLADKIQAAHAVRVAAYAAWLRAAGPPTPGNRTMFVDADTAEKARAAWDAWSAACRRLSELDPTWDGWRDASAHPEADAG